MMELKILHDVVLLEKNCLVAWLLAEMVLGLRDNFLLLSCFERANAWSKRISSLRPGIKQRLLSFTFLSIGLVFLGRANMSRQKVCLNSKISEGEK